MNEMVAFCGLDCLQCGAFLATRDDDDDMRKEVAELWSEEFEADIRAQDINCDGCISEGGIHFGHCDICEIRICGKEKGIVSCAYCKDYACTMLSEFFAVVPESKTRLDRIREGI
jgi:hypothetical protein